MTLPAIVMAVTLVVVPAAVSAQSSSHVPPGSASAPDVRADALLGLARVARDTGDLVTADTYFRASDRLRTLDAAVRREHFWVVARVDAPRAMDMERTLTSRPPVDASIFEQWIALAIAQGDDAQLAEAARRADAALPGRARWPRRLGESLLRRGRAREAASAFAQAGAAADGTIDDRAMHAVALEQAGDLPAAAAVWDTVPDAARRQRADWWASDLRARVATQGASVMAEALTDFVVAHPSDTGMRAFAVEALADVRHTRRALALITPLLLGPDAVHWRRREGEIAAAAGDLVRAREAFRHVDASGAATPDDRWRFLELAASTLPADEIVDRLTALHGSDGPCAARALAVADLADADRVFAWVSDAQAPTCETLDRLALRASRWLLAQQRPLEAETTLTRALRRIDVSETVVLALADVRVAHGDIAGADALLAARLEEVGDAHASFALVAARAWTRAGLDRPAEGWRLVRSRLAARTMSTDERADWAGLALAADDRAAAASLARQALGTTRDGSARDVLAALALRQGQPRAAYDWLAPVAHDIASVATARAWLDAVAAVHGPAAALDAADRLAPTAREDVEVASRLASWSASIGRRDTAAQYAASVAALDPDRADRLVLEMEVAAGRAAAVAARLADAARDVLGEEMLRLSIMAALDAGAWAQAERGLETWRARGLDTTWWLLKTAERVLGAEGRLPTDLRAALDASATSAPSDELTVRIAQGLAADGLVEEGLRRLGWPALDAATPVGVREAAVGLLLRAGRPADALALLPVLDGQGWPPRLQTLRARALEALGRHDEARTATESLPATARRADDWIRLARLTSDARAREGVLADALTRWPASADLWAAVATTRQHLGQPRQARDAALQALAINPGQLEAWRVRLALPPATDAARAAELAEAGARFATQPDVRVDLAEAAMTTGLEDGPSVAVVHEWLADPDATTAPGRVLRLRARLAAATGQWQGAIDAVAAARLRDPGDISLRHLDAQLHAWSGRHDEAARRFETYLTRVPTDGTAWREYARLLSWMQRASASQAAYARAGRLMDAPALAAERSTKAALARQAWRRASIEAASWLALEPTSLDARVDRALALDRSGALDAAAPLFAALATAPSLPNDLRDSAARYGRRHRVTGTVQMVVESTAGFGDQRLLEQQVTVAGVSDRVGVGGRTLLMADVARGTLDARDAAWTLTEMRTGAETRVGGGWQLSTHTSLYALGRDRSPSGPSRSRHLFALRGALDGTLVDGLRVTLAAERRPFWENGATVQTGLSGFGGTGALEWTPSARWMARAAGTLHGLTDGNRRHEASGSLALRGTRGARDLQLRSSVLLFGYDASRAAYFSPRRFVRTDLEGEVRHWVGRPRSDGDRRAFLSGSLGMGVDSRQARYGLGSALVSVPIGRRWSVEGEGRWVQASVYQSSRVAVWLRLGSGL